VGVIQINVYILISKRQLTITNLIW